MTPTRTDHGCLRYAKEESTMSSEVLMSDMTLLSSLSVAADVKGRPAKPHVREGRE